MNAPVVIIGIGELGSVLARGFLRIGVAVYPLTRSMSIQEAVEHYPQPQLVLVAVAEEDFSSVLTQIPPVWHDRIALLQNELLPQDWHGLPQPTVMVVWFEKKPGQEVSILLPTMVYGPATPLITEALTALQIPAQKLATETDMIYELIRKNVYIFTVNIAGLVVDESVGSLWQQQQTLIQQVAEEIIAIQAGLTGSISLDRNRLLAGLEEGIYADLKRKSRGRTAPERLKRALKHADEVGLAVPKLREIQASLA
ncbi:MAG: hypothetical protein SVR94_12135 [Pseudomonadota bacterium]|nr:hypothetical protein [Pseudomonadota bacterium]